MIWHRHICLYRLWRCVWYSWTQSLHENNQVAKCCRRSCQLFLYWNFCSWWPLSVCSMIQCTLNYSAAVATGTVKFQCTGRLHFLHSVKVDRIVYTCILRKKRRLYVWNCKSPVFTLNVNEIQYGTNCRKHVKSLLCTCGKVWINRSLHFLCILVM